MFYLNTIEQLLLFVEQLDQLEVFLPYIMQTSKTGIPYTGSIQLVQFVILCYKYPWI